MRADHYRPQTDNLDNCFPYIPDADLIDAVNMAIMLKRPLLVKGPPGCGKTKLAASVAAELGLGKPYDWSVKSTSKARDGLYSIDIVRRLHDVQFHNSRAERLINYISFGPLGKAFSSGKEAVVLIDEIDKADIDFPNDLLRELDEKTFTIEELDENDLTSEEHAQGWRKTYDAKDTAPIVIITSNDEKELPEAFLRRCIFHYIDFPRPEQLINIVKVNTRSMNVDEHLVEQAIQRLVEIRSMGNLRKQPATSELIDWVNVLHTWEVTADQLKPSAVMELPYWKILFKHQQDWQRVLREAKGK